MERQPFIWQKHHCFTQATYPETSASNRASLHAATVFPYLVLHRMGFTMPSLLPDPRCALTAPFHPYLPVYTNIGGLLSAALAVGSRRPAVSWHPALRCPDFPPKPNGSRDCPTHFCGDILTQSSGKHQREHYCSRMLHVILSVRLATPERLGYETDRQPANSPSMQKVATRLS